MNTITQIYDEHASMPPHDEKKSENLINYLLHGEYVLMRGTTALHFHRSSLVNSSFAFCFSRTLSFFFAVNLQIFARSRRASRGKNSCGYSLLSSKTSLTDGRIKNQIGHDYGQQHLNFAIETMTQQ